MTHDTTGVGPDRGGYPVGSRYGYGLISIPLSCGGVYWGHSGELPGNSTGGGWAGRGRGTVSVYTTTLAGAGAGIDHLRGAADAALCR
jgi:D-alanyl-D-alanine carboxypeptidase